MRFLFKVILILSLCGIVTFAIAQDFEYRYQNIYTGARDITRSDSSLEEAISHSDLDDMDATVHDARYYTETEIGATSGAALVGTDTTNFDNVLSATDTEVQTSLETMDDGVFTKEDTLDLIAGGNFDFYLNDTASGVGAYFTMSATPTSEAESTFSDIIATDDFLIDSFITPSGEPIFTTISAGIYSLHFHAKVDAVSASIDTIRIYYKFYEYDADTTETLIATSEESDVLTATEAPYNIHCIHAETTIESDDKFLVKVYAAIEDDNANNADVTLYAEGTTATRFSATTNIGAFDGRYILQLGDTTGAMTSDLNLDVNTLVIEYDDNEVGIGTSAPSEALEVVGDVKISDVTPHLAFNDTTTDADDYEIYADGNRLVFTNITDGVDPLVINTNNRVDIQAGKIEATGTGTFDKLIFTNTSLTYDDISSPNFWFGFKSTYTGGQAYSGLIFTAPLGKTLYTSFACDGTNYAPYFDIDLTDASSARFLSDLNVDWWVNDDIDDYIRLQTVSDIPEILTVGSCDLKINAGGSNDLLLNDGGGNVGIGTTNPTEILEVVGDVKISDATPHLEFAPTVGDAFEVYAYGGEIYIVNKTDGTVIQRMNDNNVTFPNHNVGIGTNSPTEILEILSDDSDLNLVTVDDTEQSSFHFRKARGTVGAPTQVLDGDPLGSFSWYGYTDGGNYLNAVKIDAKAEGNFTDASIPAKIGFWTAPVDSVTKVERLTILNDGKVGIGTSAPSEALTLVGAMHLTPQADPPASANEGDLYADTDNTLLYYDGSSWDDLTAGAAGGDPDQNLFETITGITNDVVADTTTDSLTFTGAGILTVVGTTATDTITFTATEAQTLAAVCALGSVTTTTLGANDIDITDDTPHLAFVDSTANADDFEIYADGNRLVFTNTTDVLDPLIIHTDNDVHVTQDLVVSGDVTANNLIDTKTLYFEDPTAADDFLTIWYAQRACTIIHVYAESDQTVTLNLQRDDGSPSDIMTADLVPAAGSQTAPGDTTLVDAEDNFSAGERMDLKITSVSGTPTWVSISFTLKYD